MEFEIDTWTGSDSDRLLDAAERTVEPVPVIQRRAPTRSEEELSQHALLIPEEDETFTPDGEEIFA